MKTNDVNLTDLMNDIDRGKIQLPDFQRSWIWDKNQVRYLIASVLNHDPIGALMFWEYGNNDIFNYRTIEGAPSNELVVPKKLILDGQQRLTSIYRAFFRQSPVIEKNSKGVETPYRYFVDLEKVSEEPDDLFQAIKFLPVKNPKTGLSVDKNQYKKKMFPLNIILNDERTETWFEEYIKYHEKKSQPSDARIGRNFKTSIALKISKYTIPVIELDEYTRLEAVCRMFENINKTGEPLDVFDLLTAKFAKKQGNLREDWNKIKTNSHFDKNGVLGDVKGTDFLIACTLFNAYNKNKVNADLKIKCNKSDVLKLNFDEYKECRDKITDAFVEAENFLRDERIFRNKDLPYTTQLIPMAVIFAIIKDTAFYDNDAKKKIRQWYWCGVFGEVYNNAANSARFVKDVTEVMNWINGGDVPKTVQEIEFNPARLLLTQGAVYNGVLALILQNDCKDFTTCTNMGNALFTDKTIDFSNIFPPDFLSKDKSDKKKLDCAINKTLLTSRSNGIMGGDAPSKYLKGINLDEETLTAVLKSNWIEIDDLKKDNFDAFLVHRAKKILDVIEKICGKKFGRADVEVINKFGQSLE